MFKFFINLFKTDFTKKYSKIIETFAKAQAEAEELTKSMTEEALKKQEAILKIEKEIESIGAIQAKTSKFAENMAKLIEM